MNRSSIPNMQNNEPIDQTPRRARIPRILLGALLLIVVFLAGTLLMWGTSWKIPRAAIASSGYQLVGYWVGADLPGGKFDRPMGIAVAPTGDVYVVDARKRVVRWGATGEFKVEWGRDGKGPGEFSNPVDVAVAPDGSVYVSDYDQDRVQKFTTEGKFLRQFGRSGTGGGEFDAPAGLAVDGAGAVYVADFYHHRIQKFSADGTWQKVIGHPGRIGDGALHYPTGVHASADGHLLVADAYNYQLQRFAPDGRPAGRLGNHLFWLWPRPTDSAAGFNAPTGVAVGPGGVMHVADSGNHRVVMLSANGEYLAEWRIPAADPGIYSPTKIAVSPDGRMIYATDYAADRIIVLKVAGPPDGK